MLLCLHSSYPHPLSNFSAAINTWVETIIIASFSLNFPLLNLMLLYFQLQLFRYRGVRGLEIWHCFYCLEVALSINGPRPDSVYFNMWDSTTDADLGGGMSPTNTLF